MTTDSDPASVAPAGPTPAHAASTYLPEAQPRRRGIALCLSGGGFRASLFHLGAIRRLNELGILSKIDTITSVSGGSIVSAHLATVLTPWPDPGTVVGDFDARVVATFRAFTARNLRTSVVLRRLWPWNWFDSAASVKALERAYAARLTPLAIADLPERPRFVFCATDMAFGVDWVCERSRIGDYLAGYASPPPPWPLARAVAASSCFPPVFDPLPVDLGPKRLTGGRAPSGRDRTRAVRGLRLTDGGVYDNMGLEPVWKDHAVVLVSDGGSVFALEADRGLFWRLERYVSIQGNQSESLRKRWLMSNFASGVMAGTYWGIGSVTDHYGPGAPAGYSASTVGERIATIRTDLDAFSDAEASVLENHGYLLAAAAIAVHAPQLASNAAPVAVPYPKWTEERRVRAALARSSRRTLLGRSAPTSR